MGKKRHRKAYTSKGQRNSVSRSTVKLVSRERNLFDKEFFILAAWRAGKNPWVTIPNPDRGQTSQRFIRVRANGYYGNPKEARSNLFRNNAA